MSAAETTAGHPADLPAPSHTPSWRLLATLGGAGALAGLLIVLAYDWTKPKIDAYNAQMLGAAIEEVLHSPQRTDTLYLEKGALTSKPTPGTDRAKLEKIYEGFSADGRPVGYAITTSEAGFADQVGLIFGYNPAGKEILGIKIVASKETPGLGDKILLPSFTAQFAKRIAPLIGVKGTAPAGDRSAVVMITGATISSRTVIRELNNAVGRWQPILDKYERGAK